MWRTQRLYVWSNNVTSQYQKRSKLALFCLCQKKSDQNTFYPILFKKNPSHSKPAIFRFFQSSSQVFWNTENYFLHPSIFETKISWLSLYLIGFLSDETLETCSQSFLSPSIRGAIISMGCFSLQRKSDSYLIFGLTKPPPLLKSQKSHKTPSLHTLQCFEHIIFVWTRYCCSVTILTKESSQS